MSGFDFRDMLGGANATVTKPVTTADDAQQIGAIHTAAAAQIVAHLGEICDPDPELRAHLVVGGILSIVCQITAAQNGHLATLQLIDSWRRLLDRLEGVARASL